MVFLLIFSILGVILFVFGCIKLFGICVINEMNDFDLLVVIFSKGFVVVMVMKWLLLMSIMFDCIFVVFNIVVFICVVVFVFSVILVVWKMMLLF